MWSVIIHREQNIRCNYILRKLIISQFCWFGNEYCTSKTIHLILLLLVCSNILWHFFNEYHMYFKMFMIDNYSDSIWFILTKHWYSLIQPPSPSESSTVYYSIVLYVKGRFISCFGLYFFGTIWKYLIFLLSNFSTMFALFFNFMTMSF